MSRHRQPRPWWRRLNVVVSGLIVLGFASLLLGDVVGAIPGSDGDVSEDGTSTLANQTSESVSPDPSTTPRKQVKAPPAATAVLRPSAPQKVVDAGKKLARELPKEFTFQIGSYNIQGSQHRGNGTGRAATSAGLITSAGVDVIGLQEIQHDQQNVLNGRMPGYTIWPQNALGRQGYRHQIAWRNDMFEMVEGGSVPYTFDNQTVPLPYVRLRHRVSHGEFWFITGHNSARGLEAQRDSATSVHIALIRRLLATGKPVFIVGDMNEHTEWFCKVAASTGMVSANGGYHSGGCVLPPGPLRVDWIMGGGGAGVDFYGYVQDGRSIGSGASDHYFIHGSVTVRVNVDDDAS